METWATDTVADIMIPVDRLPEINADDTLQDALERLAGNEANRTLIPAGARLLGLLSVTDLARTIEARRALAPGSR